MRFMAKHRRLITGIVTVLLLVLLVYAGMKTKDTQNIHTKSSVYAGNAMGTSIKKTLYAEDPSILDTVNRNIDKRLKELESQISYRLPDSEVSLCNRNYASDGKYELSKELLSYLNQELDLYKETDGAFNPCIRPLAGLWRIEDGDNKIPSQKKIDNVLPLINGDNIETYENGVIFHENNMMLDFGATGKGIASDEIRTLLKDSGIQGGVISIGGSICVYGDKGDGEDWHIGIQDPRAEDGEVLGVVEVPGTVTVSTSGDYEKYFEQDGARYHHILDPATGYPADSGLISVTIIHENGLLSDGLSTACFVMGLDKSMAYLNEKKIKGIFVTKDKTVYVTDSVKKDFRLSAEGYTLEKYKK